MTQIPENFKKTSELKNERIENSSPLMIINRFTNRNIFPIYQKSKDD
jgi:hypothetical protein